jgi:hypothetical protein
MRTTETVRFEPYLALAVEPLVSHSYTICSARPSRAPRRPRGDRYSPSPEQYVSILIMHGSSVPRANYPIAPRPELSFALRIFITILQRVILR